MKTMSWAGVMPAITTPFQDDDTIDHTFVRRHVNWLVDHGCTGIVSPGSLGESATLRFEEKVDLLAGCVESLDGRAPVVASIAALSTREATELAKRASQLGCSGLMVLPPYVHKGPWSEIEGHLRAVFDATDLSCMLYNNPIAYGVDIHPEQIERLCSQHANLQAVKESSGDCRRITAVQARLGDRIASFAGLDDMVVEAVAGGATGWIAGLVNALPAESIALFEAARDGRFDEARALYRWFLPLLRLDCVPEFVQLIKLVQAECGIGTERVRLPRRPVAGEQRERALATIRESLASRPQSKESSR